MLRYTYISCHVNRCLCQINKQTHTRCCQPQQMSIDSNVTICARQSGKFLLHESVPRQSRILSIIFRCMAPCSLVGMYKHFGRKKRIQLQDWSAVSPKFDLPGSSAKSLLSTMKTNHGSSSYSSASDRRDCVRSLVSPWGVCGGFIGGGNGFSSTISVFPSLQHYTTGVQVIHKSRSH